MKAYLSMLIQGNAIQRRSAAGEGNSHMRFAANFALLLLFSTVFADAWWECALPPPTGLYAEECEPTLYFFLAGYTVQNYAFGLNCTSSISCGGAKTSFEAYSALASAYTSNLNWQSSEYQTFCATLNGTQVIR